MTRILNSLKRLSEKVDRKNIVKVLRKVVTLVKLTEIPVTEVDEQTNKQKLCVFDQSAN